MGFVESYMRCIEYTTRETTKNLMIVLLKCNNSYLKKLQNKKIDNKDIKPIFFSRILNVPDMIG